MLASNLMKELKKGNQTLSLKVQTLETKNKDLREKLNKVLRERDELAREVVRLKAKEQEPDYALLNYFGGIFSQLTDMMMDGRGVENIERKEFEPGWERDRLQDHETRGSADLENI